MKNVIFIALICLGQIITASAQNTPVPNQNKSTVKTTDTTYFNSSNIINDPTYRAKIEETGNPAIDNRSNADRPNANINLNQPPPKTTNSNNPNSNKIVTDPAYNAKTYQDESTTINRDNKPVTPPNPATTTRTSPNAPMPTMLPVDSTANAGTRTNAMPSNATNGNMNNANYAGSSTTTTTKSVDTRYRTDIDTYMNWSKNTKAVYDESHAYVAENLNKMATAIAALSMSCSSNDKTMASNKNKIMANAKELQRDPHAMTHARLMRESFIAAADMLKSVQQSCGQNSSTNSVAQVAEAARKMDASKTTYSQQQQIEDFLQKAQSAINGMSSNMNWSGNK